MMGLHSEVPGLLEAILLIPRYYKTILNSITGDLFSVFERIISEVPYTDRKQRITFSVCVSAVFGRSAKIATTSDVNGNGPTTKTN